MDEKIKIIVKNRRARFYYEVIEEFEAGISLIGAEVKSLRSGRVSLKEAYGRPVQGEVFLYGMHIAPYAPASHQNLDPRRPRRLLLHKWQIKRITGKVQERGLTLVPLKLYFKGGKVKVQLALVRGKSKIDRREDIKRRDMERDVERELKAATRG